MPHCRYGSYRLESGTVFSLLLGELAGTSSATAISVSRARVPRMSDSRFLSERLGFERGNEEGTAAVGKLGRREKRARSPEAAIPLSRLRDSAGRAVHSPRLASLCRVSLLGEVP